MAKNSGKKWEDYFKQDWKSNFPNGFIYRLPDQVSGNKNTSANPCDFFCFVDKKLFMVECKEHKKASIPFSAIPQYERLLEYKDFTDVYPGVLIWFSDYDLVVWVSIQEMEKMINNKEKSIGVRMLKNKLYNIMQLPAEKQRVYMKCNYKYLVDNCEKEGVEENE